MASHPICPRSQSVTAPSCTAKSPGHAFVEYCRTDVHRARIQPPRQPLRSGRPRPHPRRDRERRRSSRDVAAGLAGRSRDVRAAIVKHQLGLDRPGGRIPAGLRVRAVQHLLALNAAIWFNWQIGELPADLVPSAPLCDFERVYAGTCGHVGQPPSPAAPKFRFASEPDVPLRSGCQGTAGALPADCGAGAHDGTPQETQDKCQSLRDRGAPGPKSPRPLHATFVGPSA